MGEVICWDCGNLQEELKPCQRCGSIRMDINIEGDREPHYFDRQTRPITLLEYALLGEGTFEGRRDYKRVAETKVGEIAWASTVWLGINHEWRPGYPPLIFESQVFVPPYDDDAPDPVIGRPVLQGLEEVFGVRRYSTEAQALAGHDQLVAEVEEWVAEQRAWIEVAVADIEGEQQ